MWKYIWKNHVGMRDNCIILLFFLKKQWLAQMLLCYKLCCVFMRKRSVIFILSIFDSDFLCESSQLSLLIFSIRTSHLNVLQRKLIFQPYLQVFVSSLVVNISQVCLNIRHRKIAISYKELIFKYFNNTQVFFC